MFAMIREIGKRCEHQTVIKAHTSEAWTGDGALSDITHVYSQTSFLAVGMNPQDCVGRQAVSDVVS
jgi:hypothetical protein